MKRVICLTVMMLLFTSCDLISKYQLFPQGITRMEKTLDLTEIFGVYNIQGNDSPFKMLYAERKNSRVLIISCFWHDSEHPGTIIVDAETLEILKTFDGNSYLRNLSPSLLIPGTSDNSLVTDYFLNSNLDRVNLDNANNIELQQFSFFIHSQSINASTGGSTSGFIAELPDNADGQEPLASYEYNGMDFHPSPSLIPSVEISASEDAGNYEFIIDYLPTAQNISLPLEMYVINGVTDLKENRAFVYGFTPVPPSGSYSNVGSYDSYSPIEGTFIITEINPDTSTVVGSYSLNLSSNYCALISDLEYLANYGNLHWAELYYTRKGWVMKKNDSSGSPCYYLASPDSTATLDPDKISALSYSAVAFSYDASRIYFIDNRTIKLYSAITPW